LLGNPLVRVALFGLGGAVLWLKWDAPFGSRGMIGCVVLFLFLALFVLLREQREEDSEGSLERRRREAEERESPAGG
jgi:hypothetical protein